MEKIIVEEGNERLDNYLSHILEMTRSQIKKNIDNIYVNGINQKCGYILNKNDIITYEIKVDEDIKPENLSNINGEYRPGIVHRIDAYTTGLLVIAKNNEAHNILAEEIKEKKAKRKYLALVWGVINNNSGTIDAPIGRDPNNRLKMKVTDINSKEAVTHFKVLKRFKRASLLEVSLETGRTHQIRCHMEYIGHPIVNDPVYGKRNLIDNTGQVLHAFELELVHPKTGEIMKFNAEIPECFNKILNMFEEE